VKVKRLAVAAIPLALAAAVATPGPASAATARAASVHGYPNATAYAEAVKLSHVKTVGTCSGYARSKFPDNEPADVASGHTLDGKSLSLRYYVIELDSSRAHIPAGKSESYMTGTLHDEYTGTNITLMHGPDTTAIQADHIVALGDAWKTGACHWSPAKRESFAIDVAELRAVDTHDNEVKSDKDAAQWLPPANRTWYVETQINIKAKYGLGVTAAERSVMTRVLKTGK
jgi:Protein of unknown function (DUF1524)